MIKGEIWWANLPIPRGSEPGKNRPVLVIQADTFNRSAIQTIICAAITTNISLAYAPGNILLEKSDSGLEKPSAINFSQILTIDKGYFTELVSMLPKNILKKVNQSLKMVLDIE